MDNITKTAVNHIESQLDCGYINLTASEGDELEYSIIVVAMRLYKEKYS